MKRNKEMSLLAGLMLRSLVSLGATCFALTCAGKAMPALAEEWDLHTAVRSNDLARVKEILAGDPGAVNTVIGNAVTPLHLAAAADFAPIAEALIAEGADVDARNVGGFTPLHWAASRAALETARLLLAAGAEVDARTDTGVTPLHWAAAKNNIEVVKLLLRAGADTEATANDRLTPLHWAVMKGAQETAELLAFKKVSDQMQNEPVAPEPESTAAVPAAKAPESEAPQTSPPPALKVQIVASPTARKSLLIDIGFGEILSLIWIEPLNLWVGRCEISNGEFRRFRPNHDSGKREDLTLNDNRQPAVQVSWNDAVAFAEWINRNYAGSLPTGMKVRLPTSSEWMAFASCGTRRVYPWGNDWPPRYGNFSDLAARRELTEWTGIRGYEDGFPVSCSVEKSGENEWGLFGLAGNVWEWCGDWSDISGKYKVRHGGSWDFDREPSLRIATEGFDRPAVRTDTTGFRIVVALQRPSPLEIFRP